VIIQRYFYRENLTTFLSVMMVVMVLFASKHFVRYMSLAASGQLDMMSVFIVLGYYLIGALTMVVPFAIFITVLITMGRMYQDNEITAMESCGIGVPDLLKISTGMAAFVAIFIAIISFWISPWAELQIQTIRAEAKEDAAVTLIEPGKFNSLQSGRGVFYAERVDADESLKNVFVFLSDQGVENIYTAPTARVETDERSNNRYLTLNNGTRFELLSKQQGYRHYQYEKSGVRLDAPEYQKGHLPIRAISSSELLRDSSLRSQVEIQWRWSLPLCAFVLIHIAVLLSRTRPRQGRFGKLFAGLLVFVFYFYSLTLTRKWIEDEVIPVELGMWWVHGVATLFLSVLYVRQYGLPTKRRLQVAT